MVKWFADMLIRLFPDGTTSELPVVMAEDRLFSSYPSASEPGSEYLWLFGGFSTVENKYYP